MVFLTMRALEALGFDAGNLNIRRIRTKFPLCEHAVNVWSVRPGSFHGRDLGGKPVRFAEGPDDHVVSTGLRYCGILMRSALYNPMQATVVVLRNGCCPTPSSTP